jgi:2-oxoglutarate ferredoxin oxidoreductase subunit beta
MYGLKTDWVLEPRPRLFYLDDYEGAMPRWCAGCGDHAVLGAVQRVMRDQQLEPEKTVVVSGIGCSSRFPHYFSTYGFHGLHGRALPVACGVRSRRPDLNIFVATGDGDNCAIGAGHWLHAIRYNMKMVVLLFDNNIYGLTKMQTSPTTPIGQKSNTHPRGAQLPPLDPISTTLSITNVSFVAQTVDWNPPHVHATIEAATRHPGLAFVRILQRCPHYMEGRFEELQKDPSKLLLMDHTDGITLDAGVKRMFKNTTSHDPANYLEAQELAARRDTVPIGLFYRNEHAFRYDEKCAEGLEMTADDKLSALNKELDRFLV